MYNVRGRHHSNSKTFCCQLKVIFLQTGISRGSTETQAIGIEDVHNFIQY